MRVETVPADWRGVERKGDLLTWGDCAVCADGEGIEIHYRPRLLRSLQSPLPGSLPKASRAIGDARGSGARPFELGDEQRELEAEAELRKMAPPNDRTVLIFCTRKGGRGRGPTWAHGGLFLPLLLLLLFACAVQPLPAAPRAGPSDLRRPMPRGGVRGTAGKKAPDPRRPVPRGGMRDGEGCRREEGTGSTPAHAARRGAAGREKIGRRR